MTGKNDKTLPTPAHTPSTTSEHTVGFTCAPSRPAAMPSVAASTRNDMPSDSQAPGPTNVSVKMSAMSAKKHGMPVKRPVRTLSAARLRLCSRLSCGRTTVRAQRSSRKEKRMSARAASRSSPESRSMASMSWPIAARLSAGIARAASTGASPSMSLVAAKRVGSPAFLA